MDANLLRKILDQIKEKTKCVEISFENKTWKDNIPSESGWYWIKTDMPLEDLNSIDETKHRAHINIPKTLKATQELQKIGIAIIPTSEKGIYVVYNGEAINLSARANEHVNGHPKTYCLGLSDYEGLEAYRWLFCYLSISECKIDGKELEDDKLFRIAVEQGWRTQNGWPILCRK